MTQEPSPSFNPAEPETWEALGRYLAGVSPAAEAGAIRAWLEAEPAREDLLAALDRLLGRLEHDTPADLDVEAALRKVRARLDEPDVLSLAQAARTRERMRPRWRTLSVRIAAGVALLLGAAVIWRTAIEDGTTAPTIAARTFETSTGEVDSLRLPDGSTAVLGPASRLTLAAGFGEADRSMELEGQALFDVTHDPDRPFVVRAGNASILDLGTTFTVRTEPEGVHVVVTAGSVSLGAVTAPADEAVILRAGDRGSVDDAGRTVLDAEAATETDLAWTRGRLIFDDAPLSRVAGDLRRWYGIELVLEDAALRDRHLTATFEGEPAAQVLDVIGLALGVRVELRGDTAFVRQPPR